MAKFEDLFVEQISGAERRYEQRQPAVKRRSKHLGPGGDWRKVEDPRRVMRRMVLLGMEDLASEVIAADSPTATVASAIRGNQQVNLLERIIEENDLVTSRFLHLGSVRSRAVGRILIRSRGRTVGFGTGFMISPRLLMTNNHVLSSAAAAGRSRVEFDFFERADGSTGPTIMFDFEPGTFFITDVDLDFTIAAVAERSHSGTRLRDRGWIPLIAESGKALIGEPVNVIQHPGGEPQQVAIRNNELIDIVGDFIHYQADTERGSSGSGVLNMQWELVGLHHAGVPKRDNNGQILLQDGTPWDGSRSTVHLIAWVANEGVRISSIVEAVRERLRGDDDAADDLFEQSFTAPPVPPMAGPVRESSAPEPDASGPAPQPLGPATRPVASTPAAEYDIDDDALDRLSPEEVARIVAETEAAQSLELTQEATAPGEVIVSEGDSWFDYSLAGLDIIDNLKRFYNYRIHNVAEGGDTLDNMAWGTEFRRRNWTRRPPPLEETLAGVRRYQPRVVLLSGGGNDVAGEEFDGYLNHKGSGQGPVRDSFVDYMFKTYFRSAFEHIFDRIWQIDDTIHFVIHGYGYAPPDGRAVIRIASLRFIGPWLRPALTAKGYTDRAERTRIVNDLIDRYNEMLRALARNEPQGRIHYIDLRQVLQTSDWENELHLRNSAYRRVAAEFDRVIRPLMP